MVAGGLGLARTSQGVVLVRGVLPGEKAELPDIERRGGCLHAREADVIEPSPLRIDPECRYAALCGGCDFEITTYEEELRIKKGILEDSIARLAGGGLEVADVIPSPRIRGYRRSARFHGGSGYIGYCGKGTREITDIPRCIVLQETASAIYSHVRSVRWAPRAVTIRTDDRKAVARVSFRGRTDEIWMPSRPSSGALSCRVAGRSFKVSPTSFFQVNFETTERLLSDLQATAIEGKLLWDLFAGVGLFSLALAERFERVMGFEISRSAVEDASTNINAADLGKRVGIARWDASAGLPRNEGRPDLVILDPSRMGVPERTLRELIALRPARILSISCDVATFSRDIRILIEGGYAPEGPVMPYDMFPRTAHIESAIILKGSSAK